MKKEKQFYFFSTLNTLDWQPFLAFLDFSLVETPPSVAAADIKQLAVFLKINYTLPKAYIDLEVLNSKALFDTVFPNRPFVQGRFEKIFACLRQSFEKFMVYKTLTQDDFVPKIAMAQYYSEQKSIDQFEQTIEKLKTKLYDEPAKDRHIYAKIYWAELLDTEFQSLYNVKKGDVNYKNVVRSLDIFYITSRLDWLCVYFNQKRMVELDIENEQILLANLDAIIEKKALTDTPSVKAYRKAIDLLLGIGNFDEFQAIITQTDDFLTFEQRQKLHALERNFCAARFNAGQQDYLPKLTNLLKTHLAAGYLYYESGLIPSTLQNLTTIGLRSRDFEWVKELLQDHKNRIISQDDSHEIFNLNWANLQFALGHYDEVLHVLQSPYKFRDIYYDLTSRSLEIKTLYEQDNQGLCAFRCDAFKNYLFNWTKKNKTNSLPPHVFDLNNNFVNMVMQLLNTIKGDTERIETMLDKIKNNRVYGERDWLLEKWSHLS